MVAAPWTAMAQEEVKLEITGNDTMQFSTKTLEVTTGQKVTLVFKNDGKLPKTAMGHNFVLLQPGTPLADVATKAMAAVATEYIPTDEETKKKIVTHTKLLGPGESDTITFTAGAPGDYPYLCTFPGHFGVMNGVLKVKPKG